MNEPWLYAVWAIGAYLLAMIFLFVAIQPVRATSASDTPV